MNKREMIVNLFIIFIGFAMALVANSYIFILISIVWVLVSHLFKLADVETRRKKEKEKLVADFHTYLKNVILFTYTKPLKQAFTDVNCDNKKLQKKVEKFIESSRYDFSIKPYKKLALSIDKSKKGINYELNIMYLLFEIEKKGLGINFINDILVELDQLVENTMDANLENLKEEGYVYTLPPTIINFVYLSIVLFQVIDLIILGSIS